VKLATALIGHHVRVIQDAHGMVIVAIILPLTARVVLQNNLLVKLKNDVHGQRFLVSMRGFATLSQEIDVIPTVVQFHPLRQHLLLLFQPFLLLLFQLFQLLPLTLTQWVELPALHLLVECVGISRIKRGVMEMTGIVETVFG